MKDRIESKRQAARMGTRQWIVAIAMCIAIWPATTTAATIALGWDLFITDTPPTTFGGAPFEGVPLGTFDFGAGLVNTGPTDTIVERLDIALCAAPCTTTIDIEIIALQLKSVDLVDFGLGLDFYFVTLQNVPNLGTMDITFDDDFGGTADSALNVNFDLRKGSLVGAIAFSGALNLTSIGIPWQRPPRRTSFP